ncbi:hypothetical protein [Motilibacter deserti]|uniref:Uncharacterized protein n=1 Tax=Motilibacter deserti TaxID=2714956 RepID=A0ABX0GUV0_9ACTN|nr:hypothetical protein [Motilibacter deserti]NHC13486.1 hypothetical protein [Motilibacter deserti]
MSRRRGPLPEDGPPSGAIGPVRDESEDGDPWLADELAAGPDQEREPSRTGRLAGRAAAVLVLGVLVAAVADLPAQLAGDPPVPDAAGPRVPAVAGWPLRGDLASALRRPESPVAQAARSLLADEPGTVLVWGGTVAGTKALLAVEPGPPAGRGVVAYQPPRGKWSRVTVRPARGGAAGWAVILPTPVFGRALLAVGPPGVRLPEAGRRVDPHQNGGRGRLSWSSMPGWNGAGILPLEGTSTASVSVRLPAGSAGPADVPVPVTVAVGPPRTGARPTPRPALSPDPSWLGGLG